MGTERSRIVFVAGLATLLIGGGRPSRAWADAPIAATVYKSPT